MATIAELLKTQVLQELDVELRKGEFKDRSFLGTSNYVQWYQSLPVIPAKNKEVSALDELDAVLEDFVKGRVFEMPEKIHIMSPKANHVWVLKTFEYRIYGVFPEFNKFVAYKGYEKGELLQHGLYRGICDEAVRELGKIGFTAANIITSSELKDVISS